MLQGGRLEFVRGVNVIGDVAVVVDGDGVMKDTCLFCFLIVFATLIVWLAPCCSTVMTQSVKSVVAGVG